MANIPPLLSSSPPPLDITDDNEDFIDEIADDEYTYDVISDQNFNPNVMNEDKFPLKNESCQIADNDFNTICDIAINEKVVGIINAEEEKIHRDTVKIKSIGCENNNDKIDSPAISSKNMESATQYAPDTMETKEDTMNYLCHAPVKEVSELIDTPPPLNNSEEDKIAYNVDINNCTNEIINFTINTETELKKDDVDQPKNYTNAIENDDRELSTSKTNAVPHVLFEQEHFKETSNICNDIEIKLDETILINDNGLECSDDFDDFDDFICAPDTISKVTDNDSTKTDHDCSEEVETVSNMNPIISEHNEEPVDETTIEENEEDDFVFQEYESPVSGIKNLQCNVMEQQSVLQKVDLQNQMANVESMTTLPLLLNTSSTDETKIDNNQENTDLDFDEDFGDFSSFETNNPPRVQIDNTPTVLNLFNETMNLNKSKDDDALITKLQSVVTMMFPDLKSDGEISEDDLKKEVVCVLRDLRDLELTNATTFQWRNSETHKETLKALGIDSRNIMYGPRWNNGMPRFASNLSCGPLEPLKPIPATASSTLVPQKTIETFSKETENNDVPAAKFDWAGAGLVNPLDGPAKTHSDTKENPQIIQVTEKQKDFPCAEFSTPITNSKKIGSNDLNNSSITVNKIASHSFNLPETHIYTSPSAVSQTITENVVPQEKSIIQESNVTDRYKLPDNIFNTDISTESLTSSSSFKAEFDSDHKSKTTNDILQINIDKPGLNENISLNGNCSPFNNINSHPDIKNSCTDLDTHGTKHIPHMISIVNKFNNAYDNISIDSLSSTSNKGNDAYKAQSSMPKPDLLSPSVFLTGKVSGSSPDHQDDLDTSFNDFQSYDNKQKPTISNNKLPNVQSPQLTPLTSAPILTPTILQPIIANNFKPSIDWSSSDNHSSHSTNSIHSNITVEDSQTEWSDFVSISTVPQEFNSSTWTHNKSTIDINAFKVPIQIDPHTVKSQPQSTKESDVDDWTDFVSSRPVVHNSSNGFKRTDPSDKWNRTTPQFSNWQTNTYHMPHAMPNYSTPTNTNMNMNGFGHNHQSVLNDFKTSMKFQKPDTNNVQYKHSGSSKQKNSSGQNYMHNEISSISSVPELGFVVPQSLLYLSNLPKK